MRKIIVSLFAVTLTIPVIADSLFNKADGWYNDAAAAGTVTVQDNKDANEADNLAFAADDLWDWMTRSSDLFDAMRKAGMQNTDAYLTFSDCWLAVLRVYDDANEGKGTSTEVNEAIATLKALYWAAYEAYDLRLAAVELRGWMDGVSDLLHVMDDAGMVATKSRGDMHNCWLNSINVYDDAYYDCKGTCATVNATTQTLKDAYWDANEAYTLKLAADDLWDWLYATEDLIGVMIEAEMQNTDAYYDLHLYWWYEAITVGDSANEGKGTSTEVNEAIATLKALYWAAYYAWVGL